VALAGNRRFSPEVGRYLMAALEDEVIEVVQRPAARRETRLEPSPRWVRVYLGGTVVADSKRVLLMLGPKHLGVYYFPPEDVRTDLLKANGRTRDSGEAGPARLYDLTVGDRTSQDAAWSFSQPPNEIAAVDGWFAFYWDRVDHWFEEDDEVFVHPRDPHHRVDVQNSSRHVRVELDGETVAETRRPRLLFETGLPTRYYIPKMDVRMDLLTPTDRRTRCPYKGEAVYWTAEVNGRRFDDIVWSYPTPIPECPKIEELLAFFNERADIYVDGELQEKPQTPWSSLK
jgi:uncharacterized protein (DUF427 family)